MKDDGELKFYKDMFYAMGHHRYWLAQILDKPRWETADGVVQISCSQEFIDELIKVRDTAEKEIKKAGCKA